jgi:hypothetical protein
MQDFLESAKRAAGTAVERAAWEAEKMRRASARQHDVELLRRERSALVEQLTGVLLDLDARGQLPEGPLKTLADRLRTLDAEVTRGDADVRAIRGEQYVPGSVAISIQRRDATTGAGGSCPACGQPMRDAAAFCSACGARVR